MPGMIAQVEANPSKGGRGVGRCAFEQRRARWCFIHGSRSVAAGEAYGMQISARTERVEA